MADGIVQVAPDSTGKKIDTSELVIGANTVERQRVSIGSAVDGQLVEVYGFSPLNNAVGMVVRSIGLQGVSSNQASYNIVSISNSFTNSVDCSDCNTVHISIGGTYAGVSLSFLGLTFGGDYVPVEALELESGLVMTGTPILPANTARTWVVDVYRFTDIIVNVPNYISGLAILALAPKPFGNTAIQFTETQGLADAGTPVALAGYPLLVAGSDGTNLQTLKVGTDGTLMMNGVQDARQTGNLIAASTTVGPWSVSNRNVVTITANGTYAGVSFVIEASDNGTQWYSLQSINNTTGVTSATWIPGTNATASYDAAVGGYTQLRVRATAWTSGSCVIGFNAQVFAYDPVVGAIAQGPSASGTASLGNPVLMGGSDATNTRSILLDTTGKQMVVGAAAAAATVTGNPVLNGFTFTTAPAVVTTGQVTNAQSTSRGEQLVALSNGGVAATHKAASVAAAAVDPSLVVSISPNHSFASNLVVSTTGAAAAAVTATLPLVASAFHYIDRIEITRTATATLSGSATLVVTSTNLPGTLAWSFGNAMVQGGTQNDLSVSFNPPLKSSAVGTATTIVAPTAGAAVLWRINVYYHTGV